MELFVNPHAILRYRQRTGSTRSAETIKNKLLKMLENPKEVFLKQKFRVLALLNHNLVEARYYKHGEFILVVRGNELITIHEGTADRWEEKYVS